MNDQVRVEAKLNWNIPAATPHMGYKQGRLLNMLRDGRTANILVTAWLADNGFQQVSDGSSGWLFKKQGRTYRLRVGTDMLSLSPSGSRGMGRSYSSTQMTTEMKNLDGFLIVFCSEMPCAEIYGVDAPFAWDLRDEGLLNHHWSGKSSAVLKRLRALTAA